MNPGTHEASDAARDYFLAQLQHQIDVASLRKMMRESKVAVVDVRPEMAFVSAHIPGAINLQLDAIDGATTKHFIGDAATVVCYAMDEFDLSAIRAAHELAILGYAPKILLGGIAAWRQGKYSLEGARA